MKTNTIYLGIDVSKTLLHLGSKERFIKEMPNTPKSHQKLIADLKKKKQVTVVMEASGGYERLACEALQDAGIPVCVVQPSCVRYFAKSINVLAKTDQLDSVLIAKFGEATKPLPTPKTPENARKLRFLNDRRQQVVQDRVRESNRMESCADPDIIELISSHIEDLKIAEDHLNDQIADLIRNDQELLAKSKAMQELKGVGPQTANTLLSQFPELGQLTRQQVAALAGLAPHAQESGSWKGKRRIFGGRAAIRRAMYMAAVTAARWCPVLSEFFKRLRAAGKCYNVAIIACARKLLVRLNSIMKPFKTQKFDPNQTVAT